MIPDFIETFFKLRYWLRKHSICDDEMPEITITFKTRDQKYHAERTMLLTVDPWYMVHQSRPWSFLQPFQLLGFTIKLADKEQVWERRRTAGLGE